MINKQRSDVWHWFSHGHISPNDFKAAMSVASPHPSIQQWRKLIGYLLLYLGVLLLSAGVIFFMAFNWNALTNLTKFALVESLLLLFIVGFYLFNRQQRKQTTPKRVENHYGWTLANAMLLGASIMVGALLALVGQTYQTGADPWQLFATWALLILPFAIIAGFDLLWLLVLVLLNVSLVLYFRTFSGMFSFIFEDIEQIAVFAWCNLVMHGVFTALRRVKWAGQSHFCSPSVETTALFVSVFGLTWMMIWVVFEFKFNLRFACLGLFYLLTMAGVFGWYRYRLPTLYPLTLVLISLSAVIIGLLSRGLLDSNDPVGGFFMLAMVVVGLTSGCLIWLKQLQKLFIEMACVDTEVTRHEP
ncbi:DUF2157 domain-containing protein [Shewanella colwelliana]|uniref:DUF2157 domain-containing protein n=1 Tax=Shewanella colwelliana TaxID=23 RepID=UPI0037367D1C